MVEEHVILGAGVRGQRVEERRVRGTRMEGMFVRMGCARSERYVLQFVVVDVGGQGQKEERTKL